MSITISDNCAELNSESINSLVDVLSKGGLAVVPVDTVYGLIGKAFDKKVFERMDDIKGDRRLPYAVVFESVNSIEEWIGPLSFRQRRFANKLFPGPLTMVLDAGSNIPADFRYENSGIGVRVCSDKLLPDLVERLGSPIWATSANRSSHSTPADFQSVNPEMFHAVDIALDGGQTLFQEASTVVDLRSHTFEILRQGPWVDRVLRAIEHSHDPLEVLILCSGNICRSPIAGYLLRGANIRHIYVKSAGLDAMQGVGATREMVEIATKWGIDMNDHRSEPTTVEMLRTADIILTATAQHRNRVIQFEPTASRKTFLIGEGSGESDIPDPYQSGGEMYRNVANLIRRSMVGWRTRIESIVNVEFPLTMSNSESQAGDPSKGD